MKITLPILFLMFSLSLNAQMTTVTFEEFDLPQDTFLNGSDFAGGYAAQNVFFPNGFQSTPYGDFWLSGWSISTMTDSVTAGFQNQYSAKTASGFDESLTYAVAYSSARIRLPDSMQGNIVEGAYFTNSTYTYGSMRDGDDFAKAFGGPTGNDPDFFGVIVKAYYEGQLSSDSVAIILADYRFADNTEDYLVRDWQWADLSALGNVDSLQFSFISSDTSSFNGQVFINTPTYFCMDNLVISNVSSQQEPTPTQMVRVFPNPAATTLQVQVPKLDADQPITILDLKGRVVRTYRAMTNPAELSVVDLPNGLYILRVLQKGQPVMVRWVKH